MRILVTGASGLLGLNLALQAASDLSNQHVVFGTVNQHLLTTSAFSVIPVDLLAPGAVECLLAQTRPDWVINCAALAIIDACEADPDRARQMNVELPEKLAQHVARGGARLVHLSTDAVFDGQRGDYHETDQPNPLSVYATTKLQGERAVTVADPTAIVARVNFFGWSLSGERSLAEFFYYHLKAGQPVLGFTDVYFCPLFVADLASLIFRMLEAGLSGCYHAVSRECTDKYTFGLALARRFRLDESLITPAPVAQVGLRAVRSPNLTLRTDKLAQRLGPLPNWRTGLDRLYRQFQQGFPEQLKAMDQER
jgi:dTDP-4-dehydrorhamnose reductase